MLHVRRDTQQHHFPSLKIRLGCDNRQAAPYCKVQSAGNLSDWSPIKYCAAKQRIKVLGFPTRPCLKNGNMTKCGGFCCQTRPIFRKNTGCLSRKIGEVWRKKACCLGVLTIFKQALRNSISHHQPSAALFSPCSDGCLALPYRHGSKTTSFPSNFRIMATFSPS